MGIQLKTIWIKICLFLSIQLANIGINVLKDNTNLLDQDIINELDELNKLSVMF